jgi:hypothetical protein
MNSGSPFGTDTAFSAFSIDYPDNTTHPDEPSTGEKRMVSSADSDPKHHTQKMRQRLEETRTHLRQDIEKVDKPQFKAMFETSAEVLGGLIKAFQDYERKNESAWRR